MFHLWRKEEKLVDLGNEDAQKWKQRLPILPGKIRLFWGVGFLPYERLKYFYPSHSLNLAPKTDVHGISLLSLCASKMIWITPQKTTVTWKEEDHFLLLDISFLFLGGLPRILTWPMLYSLTATPAIENLPRIFSKKKRNDHQQAEAPGQVSMFVTEIAQPKGSRNNKHLCCIYSTNPWDIIFRYKVDSWQFLH